MKTWRVLIAASIVCLAVSPALADTEAPVKWSQMPRMDAYGYDFSSEVSVPSLVADDFLCENGLPVIDVHWWGSYYDSGPAWPYPNDDSFPDPTVVAAGTPVSPGWIAGFFIEFYTDIPAGADPLMPWSHPGQLLYEEFIDAAQFTEVYYTTLDVIGGVQHNVWQYNVDLPRPFEQEIDNIYWLKIQAYLLEPEPIQWGWHEADSLWHDNAVQMGYGRPGMWELLADKDMAFELSVIPEPATMALVLGGVLVGYVYRRRLS